MRLSLVRDREQNNPSLQVHLIFDALRGTRDKLSSKMMVLPLLQEFPQHMKLSLFHTHKLRGFVKKILPDRFNEGIGLFHMKVYVFDNDVVISG